jgi:hypothetical protein
MQYVIVTCGGIIVGRLTAPNDGHIQPKHIVIENVGHGNKLHLRWKYIYTK